MTKDKPDDHRNDAIQPHILKNPSREPLLAWLLADVMSLPVETDRLHQPVSLSNLRKQGKI